MKRTHKGRGFFLVLVLLLGSPFSNHAQEALVRSITHISGDLYRVVNNVHRTVFVVTPDGIILADPISTDMSTWLKGELASRFGVPVRYVLYTHYHEDHVSGGGVFADTARFVGHFNMLAHLALLPSRTPMPTDIARLDSNGNGQLENDEAEGRVKSNFKYYDVDGDGVLSGAEVARGPLNDIQPPDITYTEKLTLALGGKTVEMVWTGPITHSDDMSVIRFVDEGAVFLADMVNLQTLPSPMRTLGPPSGGGLLEEWIASIRAVEAMDFDIATAGHGPVGDKSDITEFREYVEEMRDAVAEGISAGQSLEEMQASIMMEAYSDWFMFDTWRPENITGMYNLLTGAEKTPLSIELIQRLSAPRR